MARGCGVLGAGGGGDVYYCLLQALQASEDYGPVPLVDVDELPDDALIMPCGAIGSPLVGVEKFENGDEGDRLREYLQFLTGRRVAALMVGEIGGGNGLLPIAWARGWGCRWWTPTAWDERSRRCRRSPCTWLVSQQVLPW